MQEIVKNQETALQSIGNESLDMQITTAKSYPRNSKKAVADVMHMATFSKKIAESCTYSVPRQGGAITGASIRLAEIFAQQWGNLYIHSRVKEIDPKGRFVVSEAAVWDLQNNVKIITECRKKTTKKATQDYPGGAPYSEDMQIMTANAAISIALRNAIFRVVPKAYIDEVYEKTLKIGFDSPAETMKVKIDNAIKFFVDHGFKEDHICKFLNVKAKEEIERKHLIILGGIKNRIDDNLIAPQDALPTDPKDFTDNNDVDDFRTALDSENKS